MAASMTVLGRVFPPAHLTQDTHARPGHALGFGQSSGRVVPAGGAFYIGITHEAIAALTRINAKVRRSHAWQQRATDPRHTGE